MLKTILAIIFVAIVGVIIFYPRDYTPTIKYMDIIDSLQQEINTISKKRDSIDQRIDTVTVTIEKTRIQYEKDYNTILNNTINEDYMFFTEYVRDYKSRFDSSNNF